MTTSRICNWVLKNMMNKQFLFQRGHIMTLAIWPQYEVLIIHLLYLICM